MRYRVQDWATWMAVLLCSALIASAPASQPSASDLASQLLSAKRAESKAKAAYDQAVQSDPAVKTRRADVSRARAAMVEARDHGPEAAFADAMQKYQGAVRAEAKAVNDAAPEQEAEWSHLKSVVSALEARLKTAESREEFINSLAAPPVQVGELTMYVRKASVAAVPFYTFDGRMHQGEASLSLAVEVVNNSTARKFDYETWGKDASAVDDRGNKYTVMNFGLCRGQIDYHEALHPGEHFFDLLFLQRPVDESGDLTVTLPGSNLGIDRDITFALPIKKVAQNEPPLIDWAEKWFPKEFPSRE